MKNTIPTIALLISIILVALGALGLMAGSVSAAPVRIMCVGDSLTVGYSNPPSWTVPYTFGYRGGLYTRLTNADYNFQFVGTSGEPWNLPFGASFGLPTVIQGPDLRTVNQDYHEGYGGATTSQILYGGQVSGSSNIVPSITTMLNADNPDVVLLMIGINGVSDAMSNIDPLVGQIVTTKPNAKLIVAQITPRSSYESDIVSYNSYIKNTVVPKYQALGDHVTTVDQYSNLLTNPSDLTSINASLFTDTAHLQPAGYDRLAQTWFTGIEAVLPVPEPGSLSLLASLGLLLAGRACWQVCRREKGDSPPLCEAPSGPCRQRGTVPLFPGVGLEVIVCGPLPSSTKNNITRRGSTAMASLTRPARTRPFCLAVLGIFGLMADAASATVLRIMPLGDSITSGYTDSSWSVPFTFGYRGPLYTRLTNAGYNFQFVGASQEPWVGSPYGPPTTISGPDLRSVGQDGHRGYGGSVISDLLNGNGADPGVVADLNADNPEHRLADDRHQRHLLLWQRRKPDRARKLSQQPGEHDLDYKTERQVDCRPDQFLL